MVAELVWLEILAGLAIRLLCRLQKGLVSGCHNAKKLRVALVVLQTYSGY